MLRNKLNEIAGMVCGALLATSLTVNGSNVGVPMSNKEKVVTLLKSFETGDSKPVSYINPKKYIQHNLAVGDGLEGLSELAKNLPAGDVRVNTVRVFQDGDHVFAHTDYDFFGPKVGFDVFRFEDGMIVEHWDNLQEKPASPNPSGHTMLDGPTESKDHDRTESNKALVQDFVTTILIRGEMDKLGNYFDGDNYTQHNPNIADGLSGLGAALEEMAKNNITMRYDRIHKVLGEGNFVLVMSEGEFAGQPSAFYDLFRVEKGRIVEHWDTIETIPPREKWANDNSKF